MKQHVHPQPLHTSMAAGVRRMIPHPSHWAASGSRGHRPQGQHGRVMPSTWADKLGCCFGQPNVYGERDTVSQDCFLVPLWCRVKRPHSV